MDDLKIYISDERYHELFDGGRNKVLLSLVTSEEFIKKFNAVPSYIDWKEKFRQFLDGNSSLDLFEFLKNIINYHAYFDYLINIEVLDFRLHSDKYSIDNNGICKDGDFSSIRYILKENGKVYKMKTSKFFHKVTENLTYIPEVVRHWLAEVAAEKRKAMLIDSDDKYTLHTGNKLEDFERIYGKGESSEQFHSCMSGGQHASFYVNSVNATAAWLEDSEKNVVCRCVIFNEVKDSNGITYRLAERQYSNRDFLKEILIIKLISANLIDGYKKIGAGCHDCMAFYNNDGEPIPNTYFSIFCELYPSDILSYQDSFKYYHDIEKRAYNYNEYQELDTTSLRVSFSGKISAIKCPNCGRYFKHRSCEKDGYFYCSENCKKAGGTTFLDNGIQKIERKEYLEYSNELKCRIKRYYFESKECFIFEGKSYIGHYTEVEGQKIPTESIIQQFSLTGEFIGEYLSCKQAGIKLNLKDCSRIKKCLDGEQKTAYKFIWKYKV